MRESGRAGQPPGLWPGLRPCWLGGAGGGGGKGGRKRRRGSRKTSSRARAWARWDHPPPKLIPSWCPQTLPPSPPAAPPGCCSAGFQQALKTGALYSRPPCVFLPVETRILENLGKKESTREHCQKLKEHQGPSEEHAGKAKVVWPHQTRLGTGDR